MKKNLSLAAFLIFALVVATKVSYAEDVEKTFKVGKNNNLSTDLRHGNLIINTWDKDEAKILAQNVDSDELDKLTIEQNGSDVSVSFKGEDSEKFSVEVWIPVQFNINARTGGGNVKLNNLLSGNFCISSGGGNIKTSKVKGKVDISSGGGNIKCDEIEGDINISTGGGEVRVSGITGKAEVSTGGGNIDIGNINKSAEISSAGGNIKVGNVDGNVEIATAGGNIKIGSVSGTAEISSGGGNISLSSSKGKVEVSTGGGNINLKNIGGGIEALTGAGEIDVELSADLKSNSSLSTGAGNITLTVPEKIKATIIATVKTKYIDKDDESYIHIKSDFEGLKYDVNDSKREVVAKLELNGGGPVVELETAMGKIEIKKK